MSMKVIFLKLIADASNYQAQWRAAPEQLRGGIQTQKGGTMAKKMKLVKFDEKSCRVTLVAQEPDNIEELFRQACRLTPGVVEHTGKIQQGHPISSTTSQVGSKLRQLIDKQMG